MSKNSKTAGSQFDWRLRAACRNLDPDLFFPIGTSGPSVNQIAEAKRVCLTCPVRSACLNWAVSHYQDHGIWGGMTEAERQALRTAINLRQRRAPESPAGPGGLDAAGQCASSV